MFDHDGLILLGSLLYILNSFCWKMTNELNLRDQILSVSTNGSLSPSLPPIWALNTLDISDLCILLSFTLSRAHVLLTSRTCHVFLPIYIYWDKEIERSKFSYALRRSFFMYGKNITLEFYVWIGSSSIVGVLGVRSIRYWNLSYRNISGN